MIRRFLFLALCCCIFAVGVEAAPALRGPFKVKQADGTLLTIEQFGDEWFHWTAMTDGTLVVSTTKGYCIAQIDEEGRLLATDVLAHEPAQRDSREQAVVSQQVARRALFHEQGRKAASSRRAVTIGEGRYLPHSGSPRVLAILAAFQDLGFTVNDPVSAFDQYLNGEKQVNLGNMNQLNIASVRQYFENCSHDLFSPQFDIVGPVTLPQKMAYYGGKKNNGSDDNFTEFCQDAMDQARDLVSDWSVYDNDKDGNIELVCVIFAGYGQNQGGADSTIWAKASSKNLKLNDKLRITRFNCSPELFHPERPTYINGTGVFIHEFSHCMGLPDLYATKSTAYVNNQGMESWSIMDYGLYNYNSFAPSAYTAWEQETMGWTEIENVGSMMEDGSCQIGGILPLIEGGKAYKLVNSDNDRDYIVMENIQQRGLNRNANGHGLLVYHVDYPYESVMMSDSPNNNPGHPAVAVVPAGGLLINSYLRGNGKTYTKEEWLESIASSPFPGLNEVTSLNDQMALPNYCFYHDDTPKPVGFMLTDITEDSESGSIRFTISPDESTGINDARWNENDDTDQIYDLQGRKVQGRMDPGVYIARGKKMIVK
jgi:immune inhibitor A